LGVKTKLLALKKVVRSYTSLPLAGTSHSTLSRAGRFLNFTTVSLTHIRYEVTNFAQRVLFYFLFLNLVAHSVRH